MDDGLWLGKLLFGLVCIHSSMMWVGEELAKFACGW